MSSATKFVKTPRWASVIIQLQSNLLQQAVHAFIVKPKRLGQLPRSVLQFSICKFLTAGDAARLVCSSHWCRVNVSHNLNLHKWWEYPADVQWQTAFRLRLHAIGENGFVLPKRLSHLEVVCDKSLDHVTLPSGLQHLTFGYHFNQSLDHVTLPSGCATEWRGG